MSAVAKGESGLPEKIGPYRVEQLIGKGGMGQVYRAFDSALNRYVAVKVISESAARQADMIKRFELEGQTLARINHQNVVHVHAVDVDPAVGLHYIAMEYIEGRPLSDVVSNYALPAADAVHLFIQMTEGLSALHAKNIVHRDLKPHNVILQKDDVVKIVDFGIAKVFGESNSNLTETGLIIGTVNYLAPEIAAGRPATVLSDIYSLGAIFYEIMMGVQVIPATNQIEALTQIAQLKVDFPGDVESAIPRDMQNIIKKMCARDPTQRYLSCKAVIDDLQAFAAKHRPGPLGHFHIIGKKVLNFGTLRAGLADRGVPLYQIKMIMAHAVYDNLVQTGEDVDKTNVLELTDSANISQEAVQIAISKISRSQTGFLIRRKVKRQVLRVAIPLAAVALVAGGGFYFATNKSSGIGEAEQKSAEATGSPQARGPFGTLTPVLQGLPPSLQLSWEAKSPYPAAPSNPPKMTWDKIEGATSYHLEIAHDALFSNKVLEQNLSATEFTWSSPVPGDFYLRLQAQNAAGERTNFSQTKSINIKVAAPVFAKSSWQVKTSAGSTRVNLEWKPSPFAKKYAVTLRRGAEVYWTDTVPGTSVLAEVGAGKFEASVQAINENGEAISALSNRAFLDVTAVRVMVRPEALAPPEGATLLVGESLPIPIVLMWKKGPDAKDYEVEYGQSPTFDTGVNRAETVDTRLIIMKSLSPGQYFWRVRARSGDAQSAWSETRSFRLSKP